MTRKAKLSPEELREVRRNNMAKAHAAKTAKRATVEAPNELVTIMDLLEASTRPASAPVESPPEAPESALAAELAPTQTEPPAATTTPQKRIRPSRNWVEIIAGGIGLVIGIVVVVVGNALANAFTIGIGAVAAMGSGYVLVTGLQKYGGQGPVGKAAKLATANCLIVSEYRVDFAEMPKDDLLGLAQKCQNDGKFYHVHFKGLDGNGSISGFRLPDPNPNERYYDPAEALNCLKMPISKRYLNYAATPAQLMSIAIMGILIVAEVIGLIALAG